MQRWNCGLQSALLFFWHCINTSASRGSQAKLSAAASQWAGSSCWGRSRQGSPRSLAAGALAAGCAAASVPHRGNGSGCSTVLSMRVMERGPLCLWPTRRSPGCEIKSGNMHAIKSTWPGLVCIMLERVHVLPCMHPPLPSWWKKCG